MAAEFGIRGGKIISVNANFQNNINNTAAPQIRARFFCKDCCTVPTIAVKIIVIFAVLRYNVKSVFCARIKKSSDFFD